MFSRIKRIPLLLVAAFAIAAAVHLAPAASLQLDQNFRAPFFTSPKPPARTYLLPDGKFLLYWNTDSLSHQPTGAITRHLPDGAHDPTFQFSREFKQVGAAVAAGDGKIYVSAIRYLYGWHAAEVVLRLHEDGSIDPSFSAPAVGSTQLTIRVLTVQPDGKLLVGGDFRSFGGTEHTCLVRLLPDGSLDPSFNPPQFGVAFQNIYTEPVVLADGKILVAGGFTSLDGAAYPGVARLHPDGTLEPSFQPQGFVRTHPVRGIAVQEDGKIVLGARFQHGTGFNPPYSALFRLHPDGTPDTSFTYVTANSTNLPVYDMAVQQDGRIVVVTTQAPVRFHPTGALDGTLRRPVFRDTTGQDNGTGSLITVHLLPDARILVGGSFTSVDPPAGVPAPDTHCGVVRLHPDGTVDQSFTTPHPTSYEVTPAGFQQLSGGETLLTLDLLGRQRNSPAMLHNVGRLLPNGAFDSSFSVAPGAVAAGFIPRGFEEVEDGVIFAWGVIHGSWLIIARSCG